MNTLLVALISVATAVIAAPACATTSYDFAYQAAGGPSGAEYGSGIVKLSPFDNGYATVLSVTDYANGSIITGLSDYAGADDIKGLSGCLRSVHILRRFLTA